MTVTVHTLEELKGEVQRFVATLTPHAGRATLVTLSGELGAGKTAFTKLVASSFGVEEEVTSPTFVLEKVYALPQGAYKRLVHIDAYRLESGKEIAPLGLDEIMKAADTLVLLEWPEKVADALPPADVRMYITADAEGVRIIRYETNA